MGQRWENLPWRHWTVEYVNGRGEIVSQDILARDLAEAATLTTLRPGLTIAPGPYAERAPE